MDKLEMIVVRQENFVKKNKKKLNALRRRKDLDAIMQETHKVVFAQTDCLECANCCKTTGPLFTPRDITRISGQLKLKPSVFVENYLRVDEDGDYVLNSLPCRFLGADNYCSIYEVRPKACREYPHTNRVRQSQIFPLTLRNASICPAVLTILENITAKMK